MSLQRLLQQQHSNGNLEYCADSSYGAYSMLTGPLTMEDSRRIQMLADTVATLPRGRKQVRLHYCVECSPLSDDGQKRCLLLRVSMNSLTPSLSSHP